MKQTTAKDQLALPVPPKPAKISSEKQSLKRQRSLGDQSRVTHSNREKRRRDEMKDAVDKLASFLPSHEIEQIRVQVL